MDSGSPPCSPQTPTLRFGRVARLAAAQAVLNAAPAKKPSAKAGKKS